MCPHDKVASKTKMELLLEKATDRQTVQGVHLYKE